MTLGIQLVTIVVFYLPLSSPLVKESDLLAKRDIEYAHISVCDTFMHSLHYILSSATCKIYVLRVIKGHTTLQSNQCGAPVSGIN